MTETLTSSIAGALATGLPVLLLQFAICIALLVVGVAIYTKVTPFHEGELLREAGRQSARYAIEYAANLAAFPLETVILSGGEGRAIRE